MFDARTRSQFQAMRWNSPLSETHADRLLSELALDRAGSLLDLGCGWGSMLLFATARLPAGAFATGVDSNAKSIAWARAAADEQGLSERVRFVEADAAQWADPTDAVICSGSSHAFENPLQALRTVVTPRGRLLYGDGFWTASPSPAAIKIFGEQVRDRAGLIDDAQAAGWRVRVDSDATLEEWDEFEATFRAGDEQWAASHPSEPGAAEALAEVAQRRDEYETVYRGVLGFAFLVLEAA